MRAGRLVVAVSIGVVGTLVLLQAASQQAAPAPPPAAPLPMPAILKAYPPVTSDRLLRPATTSG